MNEEFSAFNGNENDIGISKKKKLRIIIIAVVVVALIVAVSLIIILSSSKKGNGSNEEEKTPESLNYIIAKYNVSNATGDSGKIKLYSDRSINSLISYLLIEEKKFSPNNTFQFNTTGIKEVIIYFKEKLNVTASLFDSCKDLISVDLTNFDTSELKEMYEMFSGCINLASVIFGDNFSTKQITDMSALFFSCNSLTSLNLSMFDTSNVKDFSYMFGECFSLKEIEISRFNTTKAELMSSMFGDCRSLKYIDISNFKTDSLNAAENMFYNCSELTAININFTGEEIEDLRYMFTYCNKLTSIDLSSLLGTKLISINGMFESCSNLKYIDLSNFNSSRTSFENAFKNIYPNGTLRYNSEKFDSNDILFLKKYYLINWNFTDVKNSSYSLNK